MALLDNPHRGYIGKQYWDVAMEEESIGSIARTSDSHTQPRQFLEDWIFLSVDWHCFVVPLYNGDEIIKKKKRNKLIVIPVTES